MRRAWIFVALTPVGAALALLTFFQVTDWTGADFLAAGPPGGPAVSLGDVLVILLATGVVGMAAPALAVMLSTRAVNAREHGASTVQVVALVLFGVSALLYGVLGLLVWGPVLYLGLRRSPDEHRTAAG